MTICKCKSKDYDDSRPKNEQVWCLYTKDGNRLLGRHPSRESAEKQERAIQVSKHSHIVRIAKDIMYLAQQSVD